LIHVNKFKLQPHPILGEACVTHMRPTPACRTRWHLCLGHICRLASFNSNWCLRAQMFTVRHKINMNHIPNHTHLPVASPTGRHFTLLENQPCQANPYNSAYDLLSVLPKTQFKTQLEYSSMIILGAASHSSISYNHCDTRLSPIAKAETAFCNTQYLSFNF